MTGVTILKPELKVTPEKTHNKRLLDSIVAHLNLMMVFVMMVEHPKKGRQGGNGGLEQWRKKVPRKSARGVVFVARSIGPAICRNMEANKVDSIHQEAFLPFTQLEDL
uniref:(California timema) hypothetical protein n=1 Tax=Timema californicum TaxID=61474 RepID=A0A7R9P6D4_TIMCA|nr:unnamed protein product [Timema californicum]